jgi:hypothetical protein
MTTSLSFAGTISSNLVIPYSSPLDFGTGDFTVEWYQYETDTHSHARPFSRGTYPSALIAVSFEDDTFYLWPNSANNFTSTTLKNEWNHFAICRSSGTTQLFMNGVSQYSFTDARNYTRNVNLTIGNETDTSDVQSAFGGYMTYFSWNKGYARYTEDFTVSNTYPPILPSTVLMLTAYGSLGSLGTTVTNNNVGTYADVPVGFDPTPPPSPPSPPPSYFSRMVGSLYSDNTKFYKAHSLSASIGSTVRNSRAVARRT